MTRFADLDPATQKAIRSGNTASVDGPAPRSRAATAERGELRCHACGALFAAYATAERHTLDAHGGGRLETVLP